MSALHFHFQLRPQRQQVFTSVHRQQADFSRLADTMSDTAREEEAGRFHRNESLWHFRGVCELRFHWSPVAWSRAGSSLKRALVSLLARSLARLHKLARLSPGAQLHPRQNDTTPPLGNHFINPINSPPTTTPTAGQQASAEEQQFRLADSEVAAARQQQQTMVCTTWSSLIFSMFAFCSLQLITLTACLVAWLRRAGPKLAGDCNKNSTGPRLFGGPAAPMAPSFLIQQQYNNGGHQQHQVAPTSPTRETKFKQIKAMEQQRCLL